MNRPMWLDFVVVGVYFSPAFVATLVTMMYLERSFAFPPWVAGLICFAVTILAMCLQVVVYIAWMQLLDWFRSRKTE